MRAIVAQFFACISASLGGFVGGTILGWVTPMVPKLRNTEDDSGGLSSDEIGWIMSILGVGSMIGPIIAWLMLDRIGRKSTLFLSNVPMILGYAIMAVRSDYVFLLVGRLLAGIGVGIWLASGPLYIGEVAENRVRGAMGVFGVISMNTGCLLVYALGLFTTVKSLNAILALVALPLPFLLVFIPESPYYYLMKGETEKARRSLTWLRQSGNIKEEFSAMESYVELRKKEKVSALDLVRNRGNRRAMLILMTLQTMQPFGGTLAIPAYVYEIFHNSGYDVPAYTLIVSLGIVTLIASFGGIFSVDALGRRPVLFLCSATMATCLLALGTFFTLQDKNYSVEGAEWVPIVAVMVFMTSYSFGLHSLPSILLSEYFSTNVKATAAMTFTIVLSIGGGSSLKLFQLCYDALGFGPTFYIACGFLVGANLVLFFTMPETKGYSLQKIESMHRGNNISDSTTEITDISSLDANFEI